MEKYRIKEIEPTSFIPYPIFEVQQRKWRIFWKTIAMYSGRHSPINARRQAEEFCRKLIDFEKQTATR